jgi:hypothetical protein
MLAPQPESPARVPVFRESFGVSVLCYAAGDHAEAARSLTELSDMVLAAKARRAPGLAQARTTLTIAFAVQKLRFCRQLHIRHIIERDYAYASRWPRRQLGDQPRSKFGLRDRGRIVGVSQPHRAVQAP